MPCRPHCQHAQLFARQRQRLQVSLGRVYQISCNPLLLQLWPALPPPHKSLNKVLTHPSFHRVLPASCPQRSRWGSPCVTCCILLAWAQRSVLTA